MGGTLWYCAAFVCGLLLTGVRAEAGRAAEVLGAARDLWLPGRDGSECRSLEPSLLAPSLGLSDEEVALLDFVCLPTDADADALLDRVSVTRRGIPPGVNCTEVKWCDAEEQCSLVCARGSVSVPAWQSHAIAAQIAAQADVPLCRASLLGTHNSAITLADGYGNLDPYWEGYFRYFKWAMPPGRAPRMRTNNHWLSLTDQLRLGARVLEVDTHWVGGELRVAHCGGLHVPQLNAIVKALNLVAKLLGRPIRWDTETVGCVPSLSSIPALEQRTLLDALLEVRAWMEGGEGLATADRPDVVVLFFDDQDDIGKWGLLPRFLDDLASGLDSRQIYTPRDHDAWRRGNGSADEDSKTDWPTPRELARMGKRVILVSGADYGPAMRELMFAKESGEVCGWHEPPLRTLRGAPHCDADGARSERGAQGPWSPLRQGQVQLTPTTHLWDGTWTRAIACELEYGPLNCEFQWGAGNEPWLDAAGLASLAPCGLSVPSPDSLTPQRAAGALWGWAPAQPPPQRRLPQAPQLTGWIGALLRSIWDLFGIARLQQEYAPAGCAAVEAGTGRWVATRCAQDLPTACRQPAEANGTWWLDSGWLLARGPRGECPPGSSADLPRHAVDNARLARALARDGGALAWLPLLGGERAWDMSALPDWAGP